MAAAPILCARWECTKKASKTKPLCYEHWSQWENYELEECSKCRWFYGQDDTWLYDLGEWPEYEQDYPMLCDHCLTLMHRDKLDATTQTARFEDNLKTLGLDPEQAQLAAERMAHRWAAQLTIMQDRPVSTHLPLQRVKRYVYVLKLSNGRFYVGQTTDLTARLGEHRDDLTVTTRGLEPKLVYFETFEGDKAMVTQREDELTLLANSPVGQRRLRQKVEEFRVPLRLLDLEA